MKDRDVTMTRVLFGFLLALVGVSMAMGIAVLWWCLTIVGS